MLKQRQEKLGQRELQQLNQAAAELQHESWKRCLNMEGKEEERSEDLNVNIMPEMTEEVPDSDPHSTSKQGDHNVSLEHSYWLRLSGMRTPKSTSKDLIRLLPRIWVRSTQQGDNIEPTETYGDPQICVQLLCSNPPVNWNARYLATGNTPTAWRGVRWSLPRSYSGIPGWVSTSRTSQEVPRDYHQVNINIVIITEAWYLSSLNIGLDWIVYCIKSDNEMTRQKKL